MHRSTRKPDSTCGSEHGPAERVALFMPSLGGGGAERAMLNLAGGLLDAGLQVDLVLCRAEGPYRQQVPPQVRVFDLGATRVRAALPGLVRYLREHAPGVLLATPFRANVLAILATRLAGVPTRVFAREAATLSESLRRLSRWRQMQAIWLGRLAYPRADGVVAVSAGVADDLQQLLRLGPGQIRVIYNPVVTGDLGRMADEPLPHPWFQPGAPPVVLGVGRLAEQKDFATLMRAVARVRQGRDCRLMILGEGDERRGLEALAGELGLAEAVAMPGFVPNPFPYMRRADVLVLSSRDEGLPNVLIQAMALGTPVVATDCPSGPAEILDHGRYAPLVAVGDVEAMADAIAATLESPGDGAAKQRLVERAELYRVERIARDYLAAFFPGGLQPHGVGPDRIGDLCASTRPPR